MDNSTIWSAVRPKQLASLCLLVFVGFVLGFVNSVKSAEPRVELLWPHGAPDAKGDAEKDKPKLYIFIPEHQVGEAAVIVFPGGGYEYLAFDYEGTDVAKWLNSLGIVSFVLDYRHHGKGYSYPSPLNDAQRAIRWVRTHATELKIDPAKIGVMGFSAGGHLASTAGTHFDCGKVNAEDPIDRVSCRPDFLILCYPVVTLAGPYAHVGSRTNLLGNAPDPKLVRDLSNETQVTTQTPPSFLFHTDADRTVPAENSLIFYQALRDAKVPAEMHIYQNGKHGVGIFPEDPTLENWRDTLIEWLKGRGLLGTNRP